MSVFHTLDASLALLFGESTEFERRPGDKLISSESLPLKSGDLTASKTWMEKINKFSIALSKRISEEGEGMKVINFSGLTHEIVLLIGCFLILCKRWSPQGVEAKLSSLIDRCTAPNFALNNYTYKDYWTAIAKVCNLGWIDLAKGNIDDQPFLVEEFVHYANNVNGDVHIIAPGTLILFRKPADHLPVGEVFESLPNPLGGYIRQFSPEFYADLFADLDVEFVTSLDSPPPPAVADVFASYGLTYANLCGSDQRMSPLRALDGLLNLARTRRGSVAMHSGDLGSWPTVAVPLVVAVLMQVHRFSEREARGWLAMVCPWFLDSEILDAAPG